MFNIDYDSQHPAVTAAKINTDTATDTAFVRPGYKLAAAKSILFHTLTLVSIAQIVLAIALPHLSMGERLSVGLTGSFEFLAFRYLTMRHLRELSRLDFRISGLRSKVRKFCLTSADQVSRMGEDRLIERIIALLPWL